MAIVNGSTTRNTLEQVISLGLFVASVLMIWNGLVCVAGSESPGMVVLTGSMEPTFGRGDLLVVTMSKAPLRVGDVVIFKVDGEGDGVPVVHRVIKVHEREGTGEVELLTKGDANQLDDREGRIYAAGQNWLQQDHIMGRVVGYLPHLGWPSVVMTENPYIKYLLLAAAAYLSL